MCYVIGQCNYFQQYLGPRKHHYEDCVLDLYCEIWKVSQVKQKDNHMKQSWGYLISYLACVQNFQI